MLLLLFLSAIPGFSQEKKDYLNETSEDFEQRMQWFTDARYGMFIHFGLYSQLGGVYKGEPSPRYAEWIQANMDIAAQEYTMLTATFNPENFDADFIAKTAK
ncbi:MAG: alpha-L-fucosidase, partial [Spirochaetales bacterium]|nr:alpha-L-fucosidase [Spirochaetales bacterium]